MQKSMIVFLTMSFSLVYVPHSFSMERSPKVPIEVRFAKCEAEMQKLEAENQVLMQGLRTCKEENDALILQNVRLQDNSISTGRWAVAGWSVVAVTSAIAIGLYIKR